MEGQLLWSRVGQVTTCVARRPASPRRASPGSAGRYTRSARASLETLTDGWEVRFDKEKRRYGRLREVVPG